MITLMQAIQALRPGAQCRISGDTYSGIIWDDKNQKIPTEDEVRDKLAELKYQEEVNVYQEKRKLEYPDWGDQLDQIYHSGIEAWRTDITKIKDKYPKSQVGVTSISPLPQWIIDLTSS